ncbi:unnamed protein product [Phytophthora fragariaefolia]|uniref:Unnamed protein product n=1 Tax=Phytophthora fragariaefolia TaxID=1490495 RepID=A0A9W6X3P6_9STRA|nr:unnamed protein product [Phytophthora fragariaefolia]
MGGYTFTLGYHSPEIQHDEDGVAAIMGAGITPREYLDEVAESLIPAKGRVRKPPVLSVEMLDDTYQVIAFIFYSAAKTSTRRESCGRILLQLPGWKVLKVRGFILDDVSVNDAECNGLLKRVQMALDRQVENLVVVGDSRIVIRQECVDCASGKGRPRNEGPSSGNIEPRRPFERVSMDIVTHMPESERVNIFLLLFQDALSGFVMCKPMTSTTAQDVGEVYDECVFRRFGASSIVRHYQDPRFMCEVFTRFRERLGSKKRSTFAYRPQANGQQERSVQTVVRSIRAYIAEADQSDWDDHAERLLFALNTSFDATRLGTPFYLVHGWAAQGTLSAMLGPKPSSIPERSAFEWRRKIQRQYSYAIACAEDLQKKAKRQLSEIQTQKWKELSERLKSGFEKGDSVWLYIPKVQPGLTDSGYRVNPWVHISRLKSRALFPKRPTVDIEVAENDEFDAALLPDNTWEPDSERNKYEVENILDLRWSKRTRTFRRAGEYLVKWKDYDDPEWLPLSQLSWGALLHEFNQGARVRARFQTMQAGDDHPRAYPASGK